MSSDRQYVYIKTCTDPHKWYCNLIGKCVELIDEEKDHSEYKCRQLDGYINFVDKNDGVLITVPDEVNL
jgi:hypothetical protein